MKFAVDVGNSSTKLARIEGKRVVKSWIVDTAPQLSVSELWQSWLEVSGGELTAAGELLVASVVPELDDKIKKMTQRELNFSAWFLSFPWQSAPVNVAVKNPESVGADRIACASAFYRNYGAGIVVDFGTATTAEVVDAKGNYQGGVIMPGINATLAGLSEVASKLPLLRPERPVELVCGDTSEAMQSGIFYGMAGAVERVISELKLKFSISDDCMIVATGGQAVQFLTLCPSLKKVSQDLVLRGLVICGGE
jgi:type III pantothenate kinase